MSRAPTQSAAGTLQLLLIGDSSAAEFDGVSALVTQMFGEHCITRWNATCIRVGDRRIDLATEPDVVLVLQREPDEYTSSQVLALIDRFALARLVVCFGPWCDSAGRTRQLWPPGTRVSPWALRERLAHEIDVVAGNSAPLPLTAGRDESYAFDFSGPAQPPRRPLSVKIRTPDPAIREWLQDSLMEVGHQICSSPADQTDVLLWDIDPGVPSLCDEIVDYRQQRSHVAIVGISAAPRPQTQQRLQAAGMFAVIDKLMPFSAVCDVLACATADRFAPNSEC